VVRAAGGRLVTVSRVELHRSAQGGTVSGLPIMPAYAKTIHKTQCETFDFGVYVALDVGYGSFWGVNTAYTLLSRLKSLGQLTVAFCSADLPKCRDPERALRHLLRAVFVINKKALAYERRL
jgi:hypothetical protein